MKIVLAGERPPSWNGMYAGLHWTKRKAIADRAHMAVRAAINPNTKAYSVPVDITVTAYFDKRPLDADNIVSKLYIDGLRGWVIVDDTPKYLVSVTTASRVDRKNPRVEIVIEEAE